MIVTIAIKLATKKKVFDIIGIIKEMKPNDIDCARLQYCLEKLDYLNNVHYGDSSLLNLYHRIKDAPVCIILYILSAHRSITLTP